ncbi:MAG: apolipoprotein N-acyltransferase [Bacteroidota bacterium]
MRIHARIGMTTPGEAAGGGAGGRIVLCVLSGLLLGLSFPPFSWGWLACGAVVPLLFALEAAPGGWPSMRLAYLAMLVFHAVVLNWTGGYAHMKDPYMLIAGTATIVLHPLFYLLPLGLYGFCRRNLGRYAALGALPFLWVGYEYSHTLSEWSFPWLTLGHTQSRNLPLIQIASVTGVYGLSFWILVLNVLVYALLSGLAGHGSRRRPAAAAGLLLAAAAVYAAPGLWGRGVLERELGAAGRGSPIRVGMVQSNIDPWEKWKTAGDTHLRLYLERTGRLIAAGPAHPPDIVIWPETAVPHYLLTPGGRPALDLLRGGIAEHGVAVLTGTQHAVFYADSAAAPPSAKRDPLNGRRYDAFNAAVLLEPGREEVPWYGKMKMVPLAERVPYADLFSSLDVLRWGVGIGGWQIGPEQVVFREHGTGAAFGVLICYESVYPDFVANLVRHGAEFLAILTIDSWWDRMGGAYQHHEIAVFRAVENRRWVARCAVGGISSFIDPAGGVHGKTELFTEALPVRTIERRTERSFYVEHGDWLPGLCLWVAGGCVSAALGARWTGWTRRKRCV